MNVSSAPRDATTRFTGLARIYDRFRPGYPAECLGWLADTLRLGTSSQVADIGAGTGKMSEELVYQGIRTIAVEPNRDMLGILEAKAATTSLLTAMHATAEDTQLPDASIALVTAGQSFHWFDQAAFRAECRRILSPGGKVALVWNSRRRDSEFTRATADAFRRHIGGFPGFSGDHSVSAADFDAFFEPDGYEYREFPHDQMLTFDEFLGRNLSATYAPREDDPAHGPLVADLRALFDAYREDDMVRFPLTTRLFVGGVGV
ncbi:class I SAM-dependent methyltransferase [Brevibacterium jeotgali]|uniref:Methyltransferase domain-containing protein n=1 Tax=Brevibacterium jeotgali TaxID=1262550 RepID=A0A2H1L3X9_9MICO|nr:class I SAM-dependent methyltransferase [Brevibacterium jeotgali]TWC01822.1 methyltransferase family protein [Brevibacterium jeotgali]SMY11569.1 Methyltransferase domain-containing protein [Brevibacterium jeotgali]